ncbi:polyprenyl synthetase family protein [Gracilibacillus alcaliphilus]|uniref:polyprenyl synthetase family protein n=1 Tax=Gracilibacillus alcaliphilus TaxID=1401441 RepID=UPI001958C8E4|nr:polyprenyl synthetase family protein [Gracilibacillus alcaliphilus]MBM7678519.1 geranylgeranyl pyrophosphate synthase [Gracilibacillus alcaliphilus]
MEDLQQYYHAKKGKWVDAEKWGQQSNHFFLTQLAKAGQLDSYLFRSVSYIYFRDLGRNITSPALQKRITDITKDIKQYLNSNQQQVSFDMAELYRIAEKESLEPVFFWLIDKLKWISAMLPEGLDKKEAKRKLIKIIAGVIIHEIEELKEQASPSVRRERLDQAVRIGYYYGLTYPLIDDLLDADLLTEHEKRVFASFIRQTLLTGKVSSIKQTDWQEANQSFMAAVHQELAEAFTYLKENQSIERQQDFLENAYLFFEGQEQDRQKRLDQADYTNEQLYLPVILKSASSRLIVRSFRSFSEDDRVEENMFHYGIYNQLADDLADLTEDLANHNVTPYTYFVTYHPQQPELINPFAMYWSVIYYFIHTMYPEKAEIREIILDRAVNGLKRLRVRLGKERYQSFMQQFSIDEKFDQTLEKFVKRTKNVAFFDKWMRDQMLETLGQNEQSKQQFLAKMQTTKVHIEGYLSIESMENTLEQAAGYSLAGSAKRLRPIMTWIMAKEGFGLSEQMILPLVKSVEYMHTASLIFDDLPSQDNALIRRGKQTLHAKYNPAVAELTGLWMTQKAVEEQALIKHQNPSLVLELIAYSTRITQEMCKGQWMDLEAKAKQLSLEELRKLSVYKTSLGFEASLMMPLILAGASADKKQAIKRLAYHAGIAFQIKDDLLDLEGDTEQLGKPAGLDQHNQSATFVTMLGVEGARREMWQDYLVARDCLAFLPPIPFFRQLLDYLLFRDH